MQLRDLVTRQIRGIFPLKDALFRKVKTIDKPNFDIRKVMWKPAGFPCQQGQDDVGVVTHGHGSLLYMQLADVKNSCMSVGT